jgi:hypothetical protein
MKYKGKLEGFPKEVVDKMLDNQELQGNVGDRTVFEKDLWSGINSKGFNWEDTEDNYDFWDDVLTNKLFDVFFQKYPKEKCDKGNCDKCECPKEKTADIKGVDETIEYDYLNPAHYLKNGKEVWEMMLDIWGKEKFIAHCEMCAFKYRMRIGLKPDQPAERDLGKAIWYEEKAKELK